MRGMASLDLARMPFSRAGNWFIGFILFDSQQLFAVIRLAPIVSFFGFHGAISPHRFAFHL
jgi:hypothetical protein